MFAFTFGEHCTLTLYKHNVYKHDPGLELKKLKITTNKVDLNWYLKLADKYCF